MMQFIHSEKKRREGESSCKLCKKLELIETFIKKVFHVVSCHQRSRQSPSQNRSRTLTTQAP